MILFAFLIACSQTTQDEHTVPLRHSDKYNYAKTDELEPDLHIPSSFVQLEHHTVKSMKERVMVSIQDKRPLYLNFARRSRSRIVADKLNLQPEDILADIGAGTGAFELLLLEGGYRFQKVYAIDTDKGPLAFLDWMMKTAKLDSNHVELVHSSQENITLPKESVTKALLLNTPFYIDAQGRPARNKSTQSCMQSIVNALKPGGELHIVERHVGKREEDLHIDDPPEMHCSSLAEAFTTIGLALKTMEMIQLAIEGEPAHCRVVLQKT
ncbi:MAG: class I SAM-dependent methyltransferase [Myxococcota bacterium]|nr:class I SAM-dependent methyltransferase [Myxococcota bacterium]